MSAFFLKLLAMGTMLVDHIGYRIFPDSVWMRVVGRTAFILYAFMTAECYDHLKDKPDRLKRHIGKLLLLFFASELPYNLFVRGKWFTLSSQNVIATLTLGFLALTCSGILLKKRPDRKKTVLCAGAVVSVLLAAVSFLIRADYGFSGVALVVLFYLYLRITESMGPGKRMICLLSVFAAYLALYICIKSGLGGWEKIAETIVSRRAWLAGMLIPIGPIALHNRKLGFRTRWFDLVYSWFYPAHMIVLILIARFVL